MSQRPRPKKKRPARALKSQDPYSALAHPARRRILELLLRGETPVFRLAGKFDLTLSALSQHLGVLKNAGLVTERKSGRHRIYRLRTRPIDDVAAWLSRFVP